MYKLLLIDDEEEFRGVVGEFLKKAGFIVRLAASGDEGIEIFRKERIDLVIVDIWMPDKDGLETMMDIRRSFSGAKVIAISGGGPSGNLQPLARAKQLGAKAVLTKPFTNDELLEAISCALYAKRDAA